MISNLVKNGLMNLCGTVLVRFRVLFLHIFQNFSTMALNFVESLFDRLLFSSRTNDSPMSKHIVGSQNLLGKNSALMENIPSEIHQLLSMTPYSATQSTMLPFKSDFKNLVTAKPSLVSQVQKLFSPLFPHFLQDSLHILSNPPESYMSSESYLKTKFDVAEQTLIMKSFELSLPKQDLAQKAERINFPTECITITPPSSTSTICVELSEPDFKIMEEDKCKKIKQCPLNSSSMNLEMASRKTKEIQKRSKKRRRRQKKTKPLTAKANCAPSNKTQSSSQSDSEHSVICDISISDNMGSLEIVIPQISSFFVSVENSADEDSDWDACSDSDWHGSEFEVTGLFVSNLSGPSFSLSACTVLTVPSPVKEDKETKDLQCSLRKVNQKWNDDTRDWCDKPKSNSVVMFRPDKDLTEVLAIDKYDRKGEWEQFALERLRFKRRIDSLEKIISPCLSAKHRVKVYQKLMQNSS